MSVTHSNASSHFLSTFRMKECKKGFGGETVVTYFFCGEEIPYRRNMKSHILTLGHFKEQLRKKGNYRCVDGNWNTQVPVKVLRERCKMNFCHRCFYDIVIAGNKTLSIRWP